VSVDKPVKRRTDGAAAASLELSHDDLAVIEGDC
jgi:hypothetical protein